MSLTDFYPQPILRSRKSLVAVELVNIGLLMLWIAFGLFLDSRYFSSIFPQSQWLADALNFAMFLVVFSRVTRKKRELMIYAVLIGLAGECVFSLGLDMYGYRLNNVPIYVLFGHALVYLAVADFSKSAAAKLHRKALETGLTLFVAVYALAFLTFQADVFGFALTALTLLIIRKRPKDRLFALTMYVCVAYLEIVGTQFQCWAWPPYALHIPVSWLHSCNPPSGISFFYLALDLSCLRFYRMRHAVAWRRLLSVRKMTTGQDNSHLLEDCRLSQKCSEGQGLQVRLCLSAPIYLPRQGSNGSFFEALTRESETPRYQDPLYQYCRYG